MPNAADESSVKEAGKREKTARISRLQDFKTVMGTPAGRRVLNDLLVFCGVFRTSFNNSGSVTSFNEGHRNVGLKILADIEESGSDELHLLAKKEARTREEKSNG